MVSRFAVMSLWLSTVLCALVLMARGLWAGIYFEPTGEALAEAEHGELLLLLGCGMLTAAAAFVVTKLGRSLWVAAGVMGPVIITGGFAIMAKGTLLDVVSILITFPMALAGCLAAATSAGPRGSRQKRAIQ